MKRFFTVLLAGLVLGGIGLGMILNGAAEYAPAGWFFLILGLVILISLALGQIIRGIKTYLQDLADIDKWKIRDHSLARIESDPAFRDEMAKKVFDHLEDLPPWLNKLGKKKLGDFDARFGKWKTTLQAR